MAKERGEPSAVRENLRQVIADIQAAARRCGRDPQSIELVGATKFVSADRVIEALDAGLRTCGENRLQEALAKMAAIGNRPDVTWHFIGRIQARKIKSLVGRFAMIQSVESLEQAAEIDRRAKEAGTEQDVLLEINVAQEETKGGFSLDGVIEALPALDRFSHLRVQGLMAIPPYAQNPESTRPHFRTLRELSERIMRLNLSRIRMTVLSMGMSHDFTVAIEEGATMVRVGSRIFGARPAPVTQAE